MNEFCLVAGTHDPPYSLLMLVTGFEFEQGSHFNIILPAGGSMPAFPKTWHLPHAPAGVGSAAIAAPTAQMVCSASRTI